MSATADIKINIDSKNGAKNLRQVNNEMKSMGNESKNIRQRLMDMQLKMAEIGDVGSAEFQELAVKAGALKDQMNNANASIKMMSQDFPKLALGKDVMMGVGGASQIAMGAMSAFGFESENATRAIQTMMGVQSLMNGVNAVAKTLSDESILGIKLKTFWSKIKNKEDRKGTAGIVANTTATKAQTVATNVGTKATKAGTFSVKAFNAAIKANPIMLLVAGVGALVGAMSLLGDEEEERERQQKKKEEQAKIQERSKNAEVQGIYAQIDALKEVGGSKEEILKLENKAIDILIKSQQAETDKKDRVVEAAQLQVDTKQAQIDELRRIEEEGASASIRNSARMDADKMQIEQDFNNNLLELAEIQSQEEKTKLLKLTTDKLKINNDYIKETVSDIQEGVDEQEEIDEAAIARWKKRQKDKLKAERDILKLQMEHTKNELSGNVDEVIDYELEANKVKYNQLREDALKDENLTKAERKKKIDLFNQLEIDGEKKLNEKRIELKQEVEDKLNEITKSEYENEILEIQKQIEEENAYLIEQGKMTAEIQKSQDKKLKKQLLDAEEEHNADKLSIRNENRIAGLTENEKEIDAIKSDYAEKIKLAKEHSEDFKNIEAERDRILKETRDRQKQDAELEAVEETQQKMDAVADFANQLTSQLSEFSDRAMENRLGSIQQTFDNESIALKESLSNREISQEEYNIKVQRLQQKRTQDELKVKRKAFEQQKAMNLVNASISTAQAVLNAYASGVATPLIGPATGTIFASIAGAFGATQMGLIASEKFKAAKGGVVPGSGPSTVDSVDALLAPGEAVINSRSSQAYMPLLSAINQAGGGKALMPNIPTTNSSPTIKVYNDNSAVRAYVVEQDISETQEKAQTYKHRSKLF